MSAAAALIGGPGVLAACTAPSAFSGEATLAAWLFWMAVIAQQLGGYAFLGLVVPAALNDFRGLPTGRIDVLRSWIQIAHKLIGLGCLCIFGIAVGTVFLIVPGLIFSLWWSMAGPVLAVERLGINESMGRSIELTDGCRGPIFGLGLIYWLMSWTLRAAATTVLATVFSSAGSDMALLAGLIGATIVDVILALIWAVGIASIYYELRTLKEGDEPDAMAAVFD